VVAATLVLAGTLIAGYGWRYGFTPLPEPIPGCHLAPLPDLPWSQVTTNHAWSWFRELDETLTDERIRARRSGVRRPEAPWVRSGAWAHAVEVWAQTGRFPEETRRSLAEWIEQRPAIELCFRSVLASRESRVPTPVASGLLDRVALLGHYPLVAAASAEMDGRWLDAFRALLDAWRFQARLTPPEEFAALFDERGAEQVNAQIARPWRRLALACPTLPAADLGLLLADLAAVTNALSSLEFSYQRRLALETGRTAPERGPDWVRVRVAFRVAGLRLRQEFGGLAAGLLERLLGGRRPAPLRAEGIRHLGRPLAETVIALQHAVARPGDFRRMRDARISHALAELRQSGPYRPSAAQQASDVAAWSSPDHWSGWRRAVDRPAVWSSVRGLPPPSDLRESRNHWLVLLESCRLTLALRAFRDQYGRWPERWAELVPAILPAVPRDPFSGEPFGYERRGDDWSFWSVGPAGSRPTPEEAQQPPQRLFTSKVPGGP